MDKDLLRLYRLLCGANNVQDVINLLQRLANDAADVRVELPGLKKEADSILLRSSIYQYLKGAIDNIRQIKQNENRTLSDGQDEE